MLSFVYLSNFGLILDYAVNILPRRKGIPGFYAVVVLIGLLFLIPSVGDNYIVGTILLGLSRVFSSINIFYFSCFIYFNCMYANISIYCLNSIKCSWIYIGICTVWRISSTIDC
jgi:hypothetical protein